MKDLILSQGKVARVSDVDYRYLAQWKWTAAFQRGRWYAYRSLTGSAGKKHEYIHHRILPRRPGFDVDHRDRDGLNCQRRNLRYLTRTGNNANQKKRAGLSSRYKGVTWDRRYSCWRAQIQCNRKHVTLGLFCMEFAAAHAYDAAARKFFGAAARPNFNL
jgi:hypothetical protein